VFDRRKQALNVASSLAEVNPCCRLDLFSPYLHIDT
jgi:hypothetical protein